MFGALVGTHQSPLRGIRDSAGSCLPAMPVVIKEPKRTGAAAATSVVHKFSLLFHTRTLLFFSRCAEHVSVCVGDNAHLGAVVSSQQGLGYGCFLNEECIYRVRFDEYFIERLQ
jgi:hypothetical protein